MSKEFAHSVWNTLSKIDVTPYVQYMRSTGGRPALRYLPWHEAWRLTKSRFPASWFAYKADITHPDHTMEVEVTVYISDGEGTFEQSCRLGVMDNKYRAVVDPHARDINDSRQRALVKALAFCGLGLNLWSDSDVPVGLQGETVTEEQACEISALIDRTGSDLTKFLDWAGVEDIESMSYEQYQLAVKKLKQKASK